MVSHYLDLIIRAADPGETGTLISTAFQRVHGIIAANGWDHVGIALPNMREEGRPHPGNVLRVLADAATLESVRDNGGITHLDEAGALIRGKVLPVPEGTNFIRYIRDRGQERAAPRFIDKSEERFIRRWREKEGGPPSQSRVEERRRYLKRRDREHPRPFLRMRSRETGRGFSLFLRTEEAQADRGEGGFNRYGLSRAGGPAVPSFPTPEPFPF